MAQGQAAVAKSALPDNSSVKDVSTLEQYEKIAHLRDLVLSGQHPTIKLPPGVRASAWSPSSSREASRPDPARNASSNLQIPAPVTLSKQPSTAPNNAHTQSSYESRTADINPLFLQKSDELIKAEFRVQRKRLEQALADEWAQHRFVPDTYETYSDTDLTLILLKALDLVQAANPAPPAGQAEEAKTANDDGASDSFDNDTFYSSKHPTPDSCLTSRVRNESEEVRQPRAFEDQGRPAPYEQTRVPSHSQAVHGGSHPSQLQSFHVQPTARTKQAPEAPAHFQVPGLNNYTKASGQTLPTSTNEAQFQSAGFAAIGSAGNGQSYPNAQEHLDDSYVQDHPPSPLVRQHNIIPAAHQPAPTPSHIVVEDLAPAAELSVVIPAGAPAQVAALRTEPVYVDSPDSSPSSGKEKKRRRKKRKADRQAPEDVMPYIKPEPRSPSPMTAPAYIRPKKRQRQATKSGNNSDQDEVMMLSGPPQPRQEVRYYEPAPSPYGYNAAPGYPQRAASAAVPAPRFDGGYAHPPPTRYIERPPSDTYARPIVVDDRYREPQPVYRERYETSRMSVRPDADPYVGQPMPPPPPQRVYIDSSGREYVEPSGQPTRQSAAPPPHRQELMYEQPPPRAMSRYPAQAAYDQNREIIYAHPQSAPRRVVTQPEYVSRSYAEPTQREYSARPAAPGSEYLQPMQPHSNHYGGEPAREYATRPGSVRPAEPYRVEYMAPPPTEPPAQYRGYSVRPQEQYYEQPTARQAEGVTYVERSGGAPQGVPVYTNDGRGEVYR